MNQKKGFYKERPESAKAAIIAAAKEQLGCDSQEACKAFCIQPDNQQKCEEFARSHNLSAGKTSGAGQGRVSLSQLLEKAKEILGCDSLDACKAFCAQSENHQKCQDFAKTIRTLMPPPPVASSAGMPDKNMCQSLKDKLATAPDEETKRFFAKYCLRDSRIGTPSSMLMPPVASRPANLQTISSTSGFLTSPPGVRGISKGPGLIGLIRSWLGL